MSGVSYDVLSQFAKLVNKDKKTNVETTVYGTIVEDSNGNKYVKIDGTDQLTPYTTMPAVGSADVENSVKNTAVAVDVNDRVSVSIKNHTATVTGNISSPAAKNSEVQEIKQFDIVMADRVQAVEAVVGDLEAVRAVVDDLEAAKAKITDLEASNANITGKLTAAEANIETLESTKIDASIVDAQYANITGQLTAVNADISDLEAQKASVEDLKAVNADIDNLEAVNAVITGKLAAVEADIDKLDAIEADIDKLEANKASINDLNAANANISSLNANKADIDFANVKTLESVVAIVEDLLKAGHIITDDLDAIDGNFTNYLTGVRIVGDIIEGNTIKAKSLILVDDENGLYYQLNANSLGIDTVKLDKEKYSNALDGSAIVEKSITAQKITVQDLVAFGAKIADFTITSSDSKTGVPGTIYSGTKSGVNIDNARGIYLDSHGQFAVGDSDNFVKFYKDTDGNHQLAIQAQKIVVGASKKNVETAINDANAAANSAQNTANAAQTNLNNLKIGGRNLLTNTHFPLNNNRYDHVDKIGEGGFRFIHNDYPKSDYIGDLTTIIPKDTECIVSAKIRGNASLVIYNISESGNRSVSFVLPEHLSETEFTRFTLSYTTHADVYAVYLYTKYRYDNYTEWFEVEPNSLKLEFGNKATDWTPAPEDIDTSISNAQAAADTAQTKVDAAIEDLTNYISVTNSALESMQGQIDGSITTWFYEVAPTVSNAPAKDWNTIDLKNIHLGDLYYDTITGYCYRWQVANNEYSWQLVKDTDVTKALEDASAAKDTADKKRQVFTATPKPPYDIGDLWVQGLDGDIMRCQTKKTASQTYVASDWVKASKYTDDTVATNAQNTANNAQNGVNGLITRVTDAETQIQTNTDNIALRATKTEVTEALGNYSTKEETTAAISVKANEITQTVSRTYATKQEVKDIEVGGRNYLLDSEAEQFTDATSRAEFLKTTFDLAPFFDENGLIEVTLSFDAYAPVAGNVQVYCQNGSGSRYSFLKLVNVTTDWQRYSVTFTPDGPNENFVESYLAFYGTYDSGVIPHVRKLKLEKGNKATDWTPAPDDVADDINDAQNTANEAQNTANNAATSVSVAEATIQQLADSIAQLVRDGNGGSLIKQDSSGLWYFNIGEIENSISDTANTVAGLQQSAGETDAALEILNKTAEDLASQVEYVRSYTDENGQPCLELGEGDSIFKVRITNTDIQFAEGTDVPAKLNRKMLVIEKAMVKQELQFGDDEVVDGVWIWKRRENGNLGLSWKGVIS